MTKPSPRKPLNISSVTEWRSLEDLNQVDGFERRFVAEPITVRAADEGEDPMIVGHGAVFNQIADIGGWFREQIAPGAFAESIRRPDDVRALFNHDANQVLGRNTAGTLRLSEDKTGLAYEIDPPDTQLARDLLTSMRRGDVTQSSFGFRVDVEEWDESDPDVLPLRTIKQARLFDVSPVTYPAYVGADAGVRSQSDCEAALAGLLARRTVRDTEAVAVAAAHRQREIDLRLRSS